ncbi:MAG: SGNH/GDSL hydrolase family protein [Pseudomonadota bacterium]
MRRRFRRSLGLWTAALSAVGCSISAQPGDAGPARRDAASAEDACTHSSREVQVLVALGSSTVAGAGASDEAHRFVNIVANTLDAPTLLNLGAGGQRAVQVVGALAEQARAAQPDVVVILAFTDYASSDGTIMAEAWRQVVQPLADDGARVYFGDVRIDPAWICGPVPTSTGECYDVAEADMIAAKNEIVEQVLAPIPNLVLVPVFDDTAAHPEWSTADGHPNDLGHANLARTFLDVMQPDLLRRVCVEDGG